jgi:hypothetical protein
MAVEIANLLVLLLTATVPMIVVYWAVRLAIRHERNREPYAGDRRDAPAPGGA